MILRSLVSGRSFARMPFLRPPDPLVHLRAKERMFLHGMLESSSLIQGGVTQMGNAVAAMDLPCDWVQFLYTCSERGMADSALIIIPPLYREGSRMTQHLYMNHGHPDGDIMTSLMAYHWFCATRDYHGRYKKKSKGSTETRVAFFEFLACLEPFWGQKIPDVVYHQKRAQYSCVQTMC